jgi:hypothetical protein
LAIAPSSSLRPRRRAAALAEDKWRSAMDDDGDEDGPSEGRPEHDDVHGGEAAVVDGRDSSSGADNGQQPLYEAGRFQMQPATAHLVGTMGMEDDAEL